MFYDFNNFIKIKKFFICNISKYFKIKNKNFLILF